VDSLSAGYGGPPVVRGVSLEVEAGQAVALLGRNGAGKTTTLAAIAGALRPLAGRVEVEGVQVAGRPSFEVARRGLSLVPQGRRVFPTLTVRENLTLGDRGGDLEAIYHLFPVLRERARVPATSLSGGEQQMLAIGRALMTRPTVLLMDEPSEGLAPRVVRAIGELVARLRREQDLSIVLAEQNLALALTVADRAFVLERGELVHAAATARLAEDRDTQRRFLGV
jgi:ABC-type branched-subunit amino acid transport system ATPase component